MRVVAARVRNMRFGIRIWVSRTGQTVKLSENQYARSRTAGVNVCIKSGNIARFMQFVSEFFVCVCQIGGTFPFPKAAFGIVQDKVECVLHARPRFFKGLLNFFVGHGFLPVNCIVESMNLQFHFII